MSKPWEVAVEGVEKTEGELAGVHNIGGAELAARVLAGRNQQAKYLVELVHAAQQASDAIHKLSKQVGEQSSEAGRSENALAEMMEGAGEKNDAVSASIGGKEHQGEVGGREKNDSISSVLHELGSLMSDLAIHRESQESALERVRVLTDYFGKYAGSLLPRGHSGARGTEDGKRLLGTYYAATDGVTEQRQALQEATLKEKEAASRLERLKRQLRIEGSDEESDKVKEAREGLDGCQQTQAAKQEALAQGLALEKQAAEQLQQQMAQFEHDRAETMGLALGDLLYGGVEFHAHALRLYSLMARACEGLGPQDIEKETGLVKSRDVAVNASLVLAKMEKEADD